MAKKARFIEPMPDAFTAAGSLGGRGMPTPVSMETKIPTAARQRSRSSIWVCVAMRSSCACRRGSVPARPYPGMPQLANRA